MRPWVYSWPQDELETCFTRPGNWSYKFYRRYPTVQPNYVRVIARLNPSAAKQANVVLKMIPSNATSAGRFLFLASVQYGHLPILNARVKVSVRSLSNGSQSSTEVDLVDDGNDSDITKGDGVYTAQLEYSGPAAVVLSADDNDEAAFSLRSTYRGSFECCDVINVPNEGRESLIPFHLIVEKTLADANLQTVHSPINLTATPTHSTAAINPTTGLPTTPFFNSTARSPVPSTTNSPTRSTPSSTLTTSRPTITSTSSKPSASLEPKTVASTTSETLPSTLHTPQTTLPSSTSVNASQVITSESDVTFIPSEPLSRRQPIQVVTIQVPSTAPVHAVTKSATTTQEANVTQDMAPITNSSMNISSTLTTASTANVHTSTATLEATSTAVKSKQSTQRTTNVHLSINLETPASSQIPFIPDPTVSASTPSNHELVFLFIPFHVVFILLNYF